jgi:hypothetical protein
MSFNETAVELLKFKEEVGDGASWLVAAWIGKIWKLWNERDEGGAIFLAETRDLLSEIASW